MYTVEYGPKPGDLPSLEPIFYQSYLGFENVYVVKDNWYYASRNRADSVNADAFLIPGGSTSDVPFYDGSLDSYVDLLKNPGRPTLGFCAGIQFLLMAQGGICARRSGEYGNQTATIFEYDEIFDDCPNPYTDRAAHTYSIADVPECYRILASTRTCYVTFARHITMPLYGSQLHIERMSSPNTAGPAVIYNFRHRIMQRKFHGVAEVLGFPGQPGKVLVTWWKAKPDTDVVYQVFHTADTSQLNFTSPIYETTELEYEIAGLDPNITHYFGVRAASSAFVDSNTAVFPIKPDGHHEIVFQNGLEIDGQTYDGCEATVIYQEYPNSNYGLRGSPGKGTLYWWDSGLVQFKGLQEYLGGKKLIEGKLTFIFVGGVESYTNSSHVANIGIYWALKDWNEGEGFDHVEAQDGEVTWNSSQHNLVPWELPGCKGSSDRAPEPIATYTIKGDGTDIAFDGTVTLPPDLLQTWVDYPDSNCGLLYEKEDTYPNDEYFYFEDNDDDWFMNHPRLTIYYLDESESAITYDEGAGATRPTVLLQNYPNPFNISTTVHFNLPEASFVKLKIYDILGREIETLSNGHYPLGEYEVKWNTKGLTSGIYFYRLDAGDFVETKKLILQK